MSGFGRLPKARQQRKSKALQLLAQFRRCSISAILLIDSVLHRFRQLLSGTASRLNIKWFFVQAWKRPAGFGIQTN